MQPRLACDETLGDDLIENVSIRVGREEILAVIASQYDVIATTGHMQARRARHPCTPIFPERLSLHERGTASCARN